MSLSLRPSENKEVYRRQIAFSIRATKILAPDAATRAGGVVDCVDPFWIIRQRLVALAEHMQGSQKFGVEGAFYFGCAGIDPN